MVRLSMPAAAPRWTACRCVYSLCRSMPKARHLWRF